MKVSGFRVSCKLYEHCDNLKRSRKLSSFIRDAIEEYEEAGRPEMNQDNDKLMKIIFVKMNETLPSKQVRDALKFKLYKRSVG